MKHCVIVPHFNHVEQFRRMLPQLLSAGLPLIVVDDASTAASFEDLQHLLQTQAEGTILLRHTENLGKGAAVTTGFKAALEAGYSHALQVDADGQHDISRVGEICAEIAVDPTAIVCGKPIFNESISGLRLYGRYLTLSLTWLETLSLQIQDAMCGFRAYPLASILPLIENSRIGKRMAFDPEILVRSVWAGLPLRYVSVNVNYPQDGASHFRYFRDNVQITWMHMRLIVGMILRSPILLGRRFALRKH